MIISVKVGGKVNVCNNEFTDGVVLVISVKVGGKVNICYILVNLLKMLC